MACLGSTVVDLNVGICLLAVEPRYVLEVPAFLMHLSGALSLPESRLLNSGVPEGTCTKFSNYRRYFKILDLLLSPPPSSVFAYGESESKY